MEASSAVTVTLKALPAVAAPGADTLKWVAAPAVTLMEPLVPVMLPDTVSVAVIVLLPTVLSVALNVPLPLVSVELAGSTAAPSVLVKCTVPAYPVAVLPWASLATTVTLNGVPAVAFTGTVIEYRVAAPGATLMLPLVPVMAVDVSVAVTVCVPTVARLTENVPTPFVSVLLPGTVIALPSEVVK